MVIDERIEIMELVTSIMGSKAPRDSAALRIAFGLQCGNALAQLLHAFHPTRQAATAMAQPSESEMFPAFCRLAIPSAYDRCAASRSPLVQEASPKSAAADPRFRWASSGARSSARRAYVTVPGTLPRVRASPARAIAIVAGRWPNSSSSTTTIVAAGADASPRISAV